MRIALAQMNPVVGDIQANADAICSSIRSAQQGGAQLVVFPELVLVGYPPKDLLLKPALIEGCADAMGRIAKACAGITALVGYPKKSTRPTGGLLHNAVAVCRDGRVVGDVIKSLLPTYDVFDERRYFEPAGQPSLVKVMDVPVGVSICEDLWNDAELISRRLYDHDPINDLADLGAGLLVNCAASPFTVGKHAFRLQLLERAARRCGVPVVFCNQVGGNDELVFDGHSCVIDAQGRLIAHAKGFEQDLLLVDVPDEPGHTNRIDTPVEGIESIYRALVLGLRDYANKCGFKSIVLGLSGGIDSALCAAIAVAALGSENVMGVAMPSRYSSAGSVDDAKELALRLRIELKVVPIGPAHDAFDQMLAPHFQGMAVDTTEENVQARIRGAILMSLSNKYGSLLITTGNKSELAVGYCTLYGDMCGGLAVISDLPKTMVWQMARWINTSPDSDLLSNFNKPVIPESTISKTPSAELRHDQTDQDSLPEYSLLDQIVECYVEGDQTIQQIVRQVKGADQDTVSRIVRLIDINEYKRKQAAPGLKVTGRAFGFGRRMPIAQRYRS